MIDLFRQWDTNGDSRVDREEMLAALTAEGVLGLDDEDTMDSLWDIFDPEEDGSVDLRSLKRTLQGVSLTTEQVRPIEKSRPTMEEGGERCSAPLAEGHPPRRGSCTAGSLRRRGSCAADGQSGATLGAGSGTRRAACASCATGGTARRTSIASVAHTACDPQPATPTTGVVQPTSVAPLPMGSSCSRPAGRRSSIG